MASSGHTSEGYFVGVDGGGTNTRMLVVDALGRSLGEGHAGSTNRNDHPRAEVLANMQQAFDQAVQGLPKGANIRAIQLGLGGVCTSADQADVATIVRDLRGIQPTTKVAVENDTYIGLTGGLSGRPGMVLIAGTGSACYGRNSAGDSWLCGGWGPLVDDVGGGYWLGLQAMMVAVRAEDGRTPMGQLLKKMVFTALELNDPREFLDRVQNRHLERAQIAALAPRVVEAAANGDACAAAILAQGAETLAETVAVTTQKLFGVAPCDLILVGGLALSGPPYQNQLEARIKAHVPNVVVRQPEMGPVQGAALEALRSGGVAWSATLIAQLQRGGPR